ncbi:alpha/beta hydrolase [Nocardia sp. CA-151230]|uniref:alpha/beta hydrolase n=1 Tax=Nocardia sp. CA-151230 TaxID=3239982 RepID=UPI003D91C430
MAVHPELADVLAAMPERPNFCLSGLPSAFVLVCDLDPLRDEALDYARRLMDCGTSVTVCKVPGAWHMFELSAPDSASARDTQRKWLGDLRVALDR